MIFVLDEFFLLCQNIFLHLQFDFIFFNLQSILRDLIIFLKYGVTIGDSLDSILRYDGKLTFLWEKWWATTLKGKMVSVAVIFSPTNTLALAELQGY